MELADETRAAAARREESGGQSSGGAGRRGAVTLALAGQSNMAGRGALSQRPPPEQPSPPPPHSQQTSQHVPWNRWVLDASAERALREAGLLGAASSRIVRLDAAGRWEPACEPLHADIDTLKTCGAGAGLACAQRLLEELPHVEQVRLIPCAVGDSALSRESRL